MKAFLLIALHCCLAGTVFSQESILKTIGGAAKEKVKSQDFNSSRSNKEKNTYQNERRSAPAAAPAPSLPPPAPDSTATPVQAPATPETTGSTDYKKSYSFDKKLVYETEDLNDSKTEKDLTSYFYGEGAVMVVAQDQSDRVTISDFDNEAAITFDEKNKTATVFSTRWATQMAEKYAKESEFVITKTGQTKQILGYTCEEYIVQDKKNKYVQWVTSDIKIDYSKAMAAMVKNMNIKVDGTDISRQTLLMEMTSYNKKGEAELHMILTEYKEEQTTKSLAGYSVSAL